MNAYERKEIADPAVIKEFALAGHATLTLVSLKTEVRFTYQINKATEEGKVSHFVSLLTEPDNERGYKYLGHIYTNGGEYWHGNKSKIGRDSPGAKAFLWFYDNVIVAGKTPESLGLAVWHEGKCGKCGRKLTVPESIARGIGPECYSRIGG